MTGIALPPEVQQQEMLAALNQQQKLQMDQVPTKVEQQRVAAMSMAVSVITSGKWAATDGRETVRASDVVHLADKINKFLNTGAV